MKDRLFFFQLTVIAVFLIFCLIIYITIANWYNANKILYSEFHNQQELIENSLINLIEGMDTASQIIEEQLNMQMAEYSHMLVEKYKQNPDVMSWDLNELKELTGYELYIIDSSLKVVKTTFEPDLELDFKKYPHFASVLEYRLNNNQFVADRMDLSFYSRDIMKFSYMPSPDNRYLFEMGINLSQRYPSIKNMDFLLRSEKLKQRYSAVEHIFIYKVNENGEIYRRLNLSDDYKITDANRLLAQDAVVLNKTMESRVTSSESGYATIYRYIPYNKYSENGKMDPFNSYVAEIIYNDRELCSQLRVQRKMIIIQLCMLILVFTILVCIIRYYFIKTKSNRSKLETVINRTSEGCCVLNTALDITEVNNALCQMVNYSRDEILGKNLSDIMDKDNLKYFNILRALSSQEIHHEYELMLMDRNKKKVDVSVKATVVKDELGKVSYIFAFISDITERKRMEEKLRFLSWHDHLTGLYNRAYFEQEMYSLNSSLYPVGIVVCDVDGLKLVNDTLGHKKGDELLLAAADSIKKTFNSGELVARIGGDEFAVLITNTNPEAVKQLNDKIHSTIAMYNTLHPDMHLSISAGYAVTDNPDNNIDEIFKEADNNMYREKLNHGQSARSTIVQTLMKALEARDFITEGHTERLQKIVLGMAAYLGWPNHKATELRLLAQFHDIGKVGIPDRILFKTGPLNEEERKEMERHSEIGYRIAQAVPDLVLIADWILKHHEWWNGEGYPLGLSGNDIPFECRILAICDAYDAMTSDRPYRKAMSYEAAMNELQNCAGRQFDPDLVKCFIDYMENERLKKSSG